MKRSKGFLLVMIFVLSLFAAAAVQEAFGGKAVTADSVQVQDFYDYARTEITVYEADETNGNWRRKFQGDPDTVRRVVDRYVADLTGGGWNFALNHTHEFSYKDTFWSVTLTYTGSGRVERNRLSQQFDDSYSGDIMIYWQTRYGHAEGYIFVGQGFEVTDLGLRADGNHITVQPTGASAGVGLIENADGTFSTSDGRLTAGVGQAAILRNGQAYTTREVSLNRDRDGNCEGFLIENFYRNEGIAFKFPYSYLVTGDSFGMRQLGQNTFEDGYGNAMQTIFGWRINPAFAICCEGVYIYAHTDPSEHIQGLTLNVLLWDTDRGLAVIYIACELNTSPWEVEALAVFNMNAASTGGSDTADRVTMRIGEKREFTFNDRAYMPSYELYTWEIIEGSANIELMGNRFQTCTVGATWQGQARIRVTYQYGDTELDVLTGIPHHIERTAIKEYLIDITD